MRQLFLGVGIAIALGAALPGWAQNPSGSSATQPATPPAAQPGPAATSPAKSAPEHSKAMHAFHKRMSRRAAVAGDTTAQLNRRELARIQAGNTGHPAPGPSMLGK